jgi:hypothetical protein
MGKKRWGNNMYASDADAVRQGIADLRNKIQQERSATVERCQRLRAVCDDAKDCYRKEHDEWERFYKTVRPMEAEVEVMILALANVVGLSETPPIILPRHEGEDLCPPQDPQF